MKKRWTKAARAAFARKMQAARKGARKVARKVGRRSRAVARKVGRKSRAAIKAFRRTNPGSSARDAFQVAAVKGRHIMYLAGLGLSTNRAIASNFGTLTTARLVARQLKEAGRKFGVNRIAVITTHDSPQAIRSFLLGEV